MQNCNNTSPVTKTLTPMRKSRLGRSLLNAPEKCYVGAENLNREVLFRIINIQIDGYTQSSIFCVAPLAWVYTQAIRRRRTIL